MVKNIPLKSQYEEKNSRKYTENYLLNPPKFLYGVGPHYPYGANVERSSKTHVWLGRKGL